MNRTLTPVFDDDWYPGMNSVLIYFNNSLLN